MNDESNKHPRVEAAAVYNVRLGAWETPALENATTWLTGFSEYRCDTNEHAVKKSEPEKSLGTVGIKGEASKYMGFADRMSLAEHVRLFPILLLI